MRRASRVVDEERLVGRHRLLRLHPVDRLVGHVHGEVVVGHLRRIDLDQSVVDERIPLVGFATDESVELVETLMGRPAVERARYAGLPGGGLVPLAEGAGAVAIEPQHLRQRRHAVRISPRVAGEGRRGLHDRARVHGVVVPPGLERIARRRAERRRVEVVESHAALRKLVHRWRANRTAKRARPAEADVVDQHDHDIGRAGWCLDLEPRRRFRVPRIELLVSRRVRFRDGQDRSIELRGTCQRRGVCSGAGALQPATLRWSARCQEQCECLVSS